MGASPDGAHSGFQVLVPLQRIQLLVWSRPYKVDVLSIVLAALGELESASHDKPESDQVNIASTDMPSRRWSATSMRPHCCDWL